MNPPQVPVALSATGDYNRFNLISDPIYRYLRVTKSGGVPGASEQDLLDDAWLQRLRRIHQVQSAWWVFAGAEHSRFQHSLGAMHLAGEWARHLYPSLIEVCPEAPSVGLVEETMRLAGLLHDVGHGPFGHFFDENYLSRYSLDHEVIGRHLVQAELGGLISEIRASPGNDFLAGERIDPRWIAHLISEPPLPDFEPPGWLAVLKPLMVGPFSADNMDYVPRDSYYCGISTGPVDTTRILHYSFISPEGLAVHANAAEALYWFLDARLYFYNQVYFHRTVRRIDLQIKEVFAETVDRLLGGDPLSDLAAFQRLTDWALLTEVEAWAHGPEDEPRTALGRAWQDVVQRRFHWHLAFSIYLEGGGAAAQMAEVPAAELLDRVRDHLPPGRRDLEMVLDVAAQRSRAVGRDSGGPGVMIYDPLAGRYDPTDRLDLFRRLPERMAWLRIYVRRQEEAAIVRQAAERALRVRQEGRPRGSEPEG